jgi:pSer/pThr/pTyr-binding forkhead associated (FHA) protein
MGVSRQHAVLIPTMQGLFITDLESTNGTWVNGDYLMPGQRYRLEPGDIIELGLLEMTVRTVTPLRRSTDE